MIRGIEVVSKENVKLENDDVKKVKIGWRNWGNMKNRMVFLIGKDASYEVRRVAGIFDGIMTVMTLKFVYSGSLELKLQK